MPTRVQLETALRNADKAGDNIAAKKLANAIKNNQYSDITSQNQQEGISNELEPRNTNNSVSTNVSEDILPNQAPGGSGEGFQVSGLIEPALAIGSSAIAEPIAGLAGIAQGLNPFAEEGAATDAIESTREALTYEPKTETGKNILSSIGGALEPIGKAFSEAEKYLGDKTFNATGSPALAAAATAIPTVITELIGVGAGKKAVKATQNLDKAFREGKITSEIANAAPSIDQLKDISRAVYKEIDDAGAVLKPQAYQVLSKRLNNTAENMGIDPIITPKANQALDRFNARIGEAVTLSDLDTLRKVAQNSAKSIDKADAAIGTAMIDIVDTALDNFKGKAFEIGDVPAQGFNKKYKLAREIWGRARRSELLEESFEKARNQASGFENGIRTQFRSILNNKRQRRLFKPHEISAMNKVVRGTGKENLAKFIGKFGFTEGSATGFIGGSVGIAGGAAIGGPLGGVIVPAIGQASKKLAQRLTAGNAEFANQVIRAGKDSKKIVQAYMKNTPKKFRSSEELSELLMKNDIDLTDIQNTELAKEAAQIADQRRGALIGAVSAGQVSDEE